VGDSTDPIRINCSKVMNEGDEDPVDRPTWRTESSSRRGVDGSLETTLETWRSSRGGAGVRGRASLSVSSGASRRPRTGGVTKDG
jgi:hypothetical protein